MNHQPFITHHTIRSSKRRDGGVAKRGGLKIPSPSGFAGSNPVPGIMRVRRGFGELLFSLALSSVACAQEVQDERRKPETVREFARYALNTGNYNEAIRLYEEAYDGPLPPEANAAVAQAMLQRYVFSDMDDAFCNWAKRMFALENNEISKEKSIVMASAMATLETWDFGTFKKPDFSIDERLNALGMPALNDIDKLAVIEQAIFGVKNDSYRRMTPAHLARVFQNKGINATKRVLEVYCDFHPERTIDTFLNEEMEIPIEFLVKKEKELQQQLCQTNRYDLIQYVSSRTGNSLSSQEKERYACSRFEYGEYELATKVLEDIKKTDPDFQFRRFVIQAVEDPPLEMRAGIILRAQHAIDLPLTIYLKQVLDRNAAKLLNELQVNYDAEVFEDLAIIYGLLQDQREPTKQLVRTIEFARAELKPLGLTREYLIGREREMVNNAVQGYARTTNYRGCKILGLVLYEAGWCTAAMNAFKAAAHAPSGKEYEEMIEFEKSIRDSKEAFGK